MLLEPTFWKTLTAKPICVEGIILSSAHKDLQLIHCQIQRSYCCEQGNQETTAICYLSYPIFNIVQSNKFNKFLWSTIRENSLSWHCCRTIMVPSQWPKNIGISPALCRASGTALTSSSKVLKLNYQGQLLERISFLYMSMKHNRLIKSMDTN